MFENYTKQSDLQANRSLLQDNAGSEREAISNLRADSDLSLRASSDLLDSKKEETNTFDKPGDYNETMKIDGRTRTYHVHVPPDYDASKPMPLVLVLHGHGDNAASVARFSGLNEKADKEGFVVAYPEAVHWLDDPGQAAWDSGNGLVLPPWEEVDDTKFLRKVINKCQGELSIDSNRTYLVGFSNGGMEAYTAAGELSDKLAAVVSVSGAMGGQERRPDVPVSMLSIAGTADSTVPLEGRTPEQEAAFVAPETMKKLAKMYPLLDDEDLSPLASEALQFLAVNVGYVPEFKPITYATNFWKDADGITGPGEIEQRANGVKTETYTNPVTGVSVEQEIVPGGDHMVQHGNPEGFNLADDVWNFLCKHPKNQKTAN